MKREKCSRRIEDSALIGQHSVLCLALGAMLFALCFPAEAQQPDKQLHRIGMLLGGSPYVEAFREGLREARLHRG